jgi:hypothetical protein
MRQSKGLQDSERNMSIDIISEENNDISSDSFSDNSIQAGINTDQHKNLTDFFKKKIDSSELPEHFDEWTVKKQFDHLIRSSKYFPNIPESLRFILPATFKDAIYNQSFNKPDWLDMEKFRRGQRFALRYFSSISISNLLSLLQIYNSSNTLKPLIYKSSTPYNAFRRYLSTIIRIRNWYMSDPWCKNTKAYREMQAVRRMHCNMRQKLWKMDDEEIERSTKISHMFCPAIEMIRKDFADVCPMARDLQNPYKMMTGIKSINQGELSGTQYPFIGLILLYPEKFGVYNASEEDFDAFCHMWRGFGYLLGIEDQYNFCNGSLQEVRQRCRDFNEIWMKTNFRTVMPDWEHMSMCLFEGMSYILHVKMDYKVFLFWLCDIIKLNMPRLYNSFSFNEKIYYGLLKFIFYYLIRLPGMLHLMNVIVHYSLDQAVKYDEKYLIKLKGKSCKLVLS